LYERISAASNETSSVRRQSSAVGKSTAVSMPKRSSSSSRAGRSRIVWLATVNGFFRPSVDTAGVPMKVAPCP
jgi:hypothetical protein